MPCLTSAVPCLRMLSSSRASVGAVAVLALGAPSRACIRRKKAPKALWLWCRHAAASRRAVAARLAQGVVRRRRTVPPDTRWCGQRPNHDVQCCTVGQQRLSSPISRRMPQDVVAAMPAIWGKSPPVSRCRGARPAHAGWGRPRFRGRGAGGHGGPSLRSANVCREAALCRSHAAIFW